jgi:DNA-binding CsgD family transcriptional regulator
VSGQTVEMRMEVEDLLRLILDQVEEKEGLAHVPERNGLVTAVLLEIEMDGAHYTITRQAAIEPVTEASCALSPREKEVARLVAKGFSNKTIAAILDISPWTVSTHLRRIFNKLDVGSRAEMITQALQGGLLI